MVNLRVGLDLDGVFFNFGDSVQRYLEHIGLGHLWKSGKTPKPFWDFYKDWGWNSEQFVQLCNDGVDAGFIFSGPVRPGGVEAWNKIVDMSHEIIVITDRSFGSNPTNSHRATEQWLDQHDLWFDQLIFSADKTCVSTDMFLEDKLSNYEALIAAGTNAFLLNRPWNEMIDARNRIDTLDQFVNAVANVTEDGFRDLLLV